MAKIKVTSKCELYDGMSFTFNAPCDCTEADGLVIDYRTQIENEPAEASQSFIFKDAGGNDLAGLDNLFSAGSYVKVILDTRNGFAYLQNATSSAHLEAQISQKANAIQPIEYAGMCWAVAPDGSLTFVPPVAKMTQGPIIIEETQTLDMTQYGLKVGDQVNVICIGGGGGGGASISAGGAGGKGGKSSSSSYAGGGGGGGGYGAGGGGGGAASTNDSYNKYAGAGGGSGYLKAATITLTDTTVDVTIGAAGKGGTGSGDGEPGGATSFGTYLSAEGGSGGNGGSGGSNPGGAGGHAGGNGGRSAYSSGAVGGGGGGGGGGWIVESVLVYSGTAGSVGSTSGAKVGGDGGTNGGAGGSGAGKAGEDGNGTGHGVVIFWY